MRRLPLIKPVLEWFRVTFLLLFLYDVLVWICRRSTEIKVILFEWGRHVGEDSRQVGIDLSFQVGNEYWVHFLKELATHVLCLLLQDFQCKLSLDVCNLGDLKLVVCLEQLLELRWAEVLCNLFRQVKDDHVESQLVLVLLRFRDLELYNVVE